MGPSGGRERLHWVLGVTRNENQVSNRKDHFAAYLGLLRKLALNLIRLEPSKALCRQTETGWLGRQFPV